MSKPILSLDFDGVIHSYLTPYKGVDIIPDAPVDGALEFIIRATQSFQVHIFSTRSRDENGVKAMKDWLEKAYINAGYDPPIVKYIMKSIQWPVTKPGARVSIDDRGITFTGRWPTMKELKDFRPWNKASDGVLEAAAINDEIKEINIIVDANRKLKNEIHALKSALQFYADRDHWSSSCMVEDVGRVARIALNIEKQ